jgi:excisionase family DNA binding protein
MDKTVLISLTIDDLKLLIIDSVNACLKHSPGSQQATDPDRLMNVDEAADFLSLSKSSIYSMTCKGELPAMKMHGGRKLYFSRNDLMEFLKAGRKMTFAEIEAAPEQFLKPLRKKGGRNA